MVLLQEEEEEKKNSGKSLVKANLLFTVQEGKKERQKKILTCKIHGT